MEFFKKDIDDAKRYDRLIKMNEKNKKKDGGTRYWSEQQMMMKMVEEAIRTNGDVSQYFTSIAIWMSVRMKYTSPEVIKLMLHFLYGNTDYTAELYGIKIFDVMKKRAISYPEAILVIYEEQTNFQPTKELAKYNRGKYRGYNMRYAYLDEDGKICYNFEEEDTYSKLTEEEKSEMAKKIVKDIEEIKKRKGLI